MTLCEGAKIEICRFLLNTEATSSSTQITVEHHRIERNQIMVTEFSFSAALRHLDEGTRPVKDTAFPTEEHMRKAMQGYIDNIGPTPLPGFAENYLAAVRTGQDPVGTAPLNMGADPANPLGGLEKLLDVPFKPQRAELLSPISFSLSNKAAMSFRLFAEVDGRNLSIDIIDVMTFDENGKICDFMAYWGQENITLLDD
jgi:steroid delta-isomerase